MSRRANEPGRGGSTSVRPGEPPNPQRGGNRPRPTRSPIKIIADHPFKPKIVARLGRAGGEKRESHS